MANEEVDDYMSDQFVDSSLDHTPGLAFGTFKRKYKQENAAKESNKKNKIVSRKELEHETRAKGLETALGKNNRGFSLLQKMGYKAGEGLGKLKTGRSEPVPINIKIGRQGLGKQEDDKRKQLAKQRFKEIVAEKRVKIERLQQDHYRNRMSSRFSEKLFERDLYKSQKACHQLDLNVGVDSPELYFYWPNYSANDEEEDELDEDEDEDEECSVQDKLISITQYLRWNYSYCIWCATAYNDHEDLNKNCPGDTSEAHDDE